MLVSFAIAIMKELEASYFIKKIGYLGLMDLEVPELSHNDLLLSELRAKYVKI